MHSKNERATDFRWYMYNKNLVKLMGVTIVQDVVKYKKYR